MELNLLNEKQIKSLEELFRFYKHFFICNDCGSLYGSDYIKQKSIFCPICEAKRNLEEKRKKEKEDLNKLRKSLNGSKC